MNCTESFSEEISFTFGMQVTFLICDPIAIVASITLLSNDFTMSHFPLHKPLVGSKFRTSMIGDPTFNVKTYGDREPDSIQILRRTQHYLAIVTYNICTKVFGFFHRKPVDQ